MRYTTRMATVLEEPGSHALLIAHREDVELVHELGDLLVGQSGLTPADVHLLDADASDLAAQVTTIAQETSGTLLAVVVGASPPDPVGGALPVLLADSPAKLLAVTFDRPGSVHEVLISRRGRSILLSAGNPDVPLSGTLVSLLRAGSPGGGSELTFADLWEVARGGAPVVMMESEPDVRNAVLARNPGHLPFGVERILPTSGRVTGLAAFTDGEARLAVVEDGRITIWAPDRDERLPAPRGSRGATLLRACTSYQGSPLLVSAEESHELRVWDARTGAEVAVLTGHRDDVTALDVWRSGANPLAVSGDADGTLRVWWLDRDGSVSDLITRHPELTGRDMQITAVATVPNSADFVSATRSGHIALHTASGEFQPVGRHATRVTALVVLRQADGSVLLASGGDGGAIRIWDLERREPLRTVAGGGHSTRVNELLAVPLSDGQTLLASSSQGGTVRLWNPATGEQLRRFALPGGGRWSLAAWTPSDGSPRLAAGGPTEVRIWHLGLAREVLAGPVVTRGFADRVASVDLLDRGAYVAGLVEALDDPGATGEDGERGPTVITVEGPWGSGKSTILDLVRRQLNERVTPHRAGRRGRLTVAGADRLLRSGLVPTGAKPTGPGGVLVATFNPWRHQSSEQVWAGLARTLTDVADQHLRPGRDERERYWFTRNAARVDRRRTQRELWRRTLSPLLAVGLLGLALTVFGQLAKLDLPTQVLRWVLPALLLPGVVHTAVRYFGCRASAFLPGELFAGPVLSTALAGSGAADPAVRDPYYHARSGYLYLVQHDVTQLLTDLAEQGYQLVVLVDDLDRCTPKTTAEVFEAINVFLSDELPRTRFVLGLDPVVVAAHVDQAYRDLADARVVAHPDDPSPGWTFLRKLVQLPVPLPRTREDGLDRLLTAHLGPVHVDGGPDEAPAAEPAPERDPEPTPEPETAQQAGTAAPEPVEVPAVRADRVVVDLERHPLVRERFRRTLAGQPSRSVREEKRLINAWQFYVRVLARSAGPAPEAQRACLLVTVAEIVTRWPAYQHAVRRVLPDGRTGLRALAEAVGDDVAWGAALAALGLPPAGHRAMTTLRAALRDCDAPAVADLAATLL